MLAGFWQCNYGQGTLDITVVLCCHGTLLHYQRIPDMSVSGGSAVKQSAGLHYIVIVTMQVEALRPTPLLSHSRSPLWWPQPLLRLWQLLVAQQPVVER